MYAIIETGGKQYKVSQGDIIYTEKLEEAEGNTVDFKVIAGQDEKGFYIGEDVASAKVSGKVLKNGRAKKITVFFSFYTLSPRGEGGLQGWRFPAPVRPPNNQKKTLFYPTQNKIIPPPTTTNKQTSPPQYNTR